MQIFIQDLAKHLHAPRESERANALFGQAMTRGTFHWGRKSKLVAGACLAVALRESKRPHTLREIAFLLQEPYPDLSHTFTEILSLFEMKLEFTEPATHIPALHSLLASLLIDQPPSSESGLSKKTIILLQKVPLHVVTQTAESLADILVRIERHRTTSLATQPTAVAVYILSLEAEMRELFPNLGTVCSFFGKTCSISKTVIMIRYKAIQDCIASCISKIDWLDSGGKVVNRLVVARGLKDVLRFQDKLFKQELDATGRQTLVFVEGELVLPDLAGKVPSCEFRRAKESLLQDTCTRRPAPPHLLPSFLLSSSESVKEAPSRIQLLSRSRGGQTMIEDHELFAEGELESFLRTPSEVDLFSKTVDWPDPKTTHNDGIPRKRKRRSSSCPPERTKKINFEVYNALMTSVDGDTSLPAEVYTFEDKEEEAGSGGWRDMISSHLAETFSFEAFTEM